MAKPKGGGTGASANGPREKGAPSLREQAAAHRAGKGSREDRIARIRGRANAIARGLTDRSANLANEHRSLTTHAESRFNDVFSSDRSKRRGAAQESSAAKFKALDVADRHARVTARADSLKRRLGGLFKSGRENRGVFAN